MTESSDTPLVGFDAVARLCDDTGILQHSRFGVPDRTHGYCIDDNARALLLMGWARDLPFSLRLKWAGIFAAFIEHAWNDETHSFRNFLGYDRQWLEASGSQDSNGRTYWALASAACDIEDPGIAVWAGAMCDQIEPYIVGFTSPRAVAFAILGALRRRGSNHATNQSEKIIEDLAQLLIDCFQRSATDNWLWFEISLAYDNPRLGEALIGAGRVSNNSDWVKIGLQSLRWLCERQTAKRGYFSPVATEEFGLPFALPTTFDQQPLEGLAAIDACIAAFQVDRSQDWIEHGELAFAWFTGANNGNVGLADNDTGECYDGIGPGGPNLNRGAESVLAWQCACRRIEVLRGLALA